MKTVYQLTHKGELIFQGTERSCYFKLQRTQSMSADWAIKYEGWKIVEKEVKEEEYNLIMSKDNFRKLL
jgi:hypothetical protein